MPFLPEPEKAFSFSEQSSSQSREIIREAHSKARKNLQIKLNEEAAPHINEWVEREDIIGVLNYYWLDERCRIVSLIGLGGEGKSTLARHWLEQLLSSDEDFQQPDGVFWWSFYQRPDINDFFESALSYFSAGELSSKDIEALSDSWAASLTGILMAGHYLLILDGLEVEQHQNNEDYGLLINNKLANFLKYLATENHQSFCLITSRVKVGDLMPYVTHTSCNVGGLKKEEGRELLRKIGIRGSNSDLDEVVKAWHGHALMLRLLGSYLVENYHGDVKAAREIVPPELNELVYAGVGQVLRRYDSLLNEEAREIMHLLSTFRLPVPEFIVKSDLNLDSKIIQQLICWGILQYNLYKKHYIIHPLVRAYYVAQRNQSVIEFLQFWLEEEDETGDSNY